MAIIYNTYIEIIGPTATVASPTLERMFREQVDRPIVLQKVSHTLRVRVCVVEKV
jgi:hypothetical protein